MTGITNNLAQLSQAQQRALKHATNFLGDNEEKLRGTWGDGCRFQVILDGASEVQIGVRLASVRAITDTVTQLRKQEKIAEKHTEEVEGKCTKSLQEIAELSKKVAEMSKSFAAEGITDLENQLANVQKDLAKEKEEKNKLSKRLETESQIVLDLGKTVEDLRLKFAEQRTIEIDPLTTNLLNARQELQQEKKKAKAEKKESEQRDQELNAEIALLKEAKKPLSDQLQTASAGVASAKSESENEKLSDQLQTAKADLDSQREAVSKLQTQLLDNANLLSKSKEDASRFKTNIETLEQINRALESVLSQYKQAETTRAETQQELERLEKAIRGELPPIPLPGSRGRGRGAGARSTA